MQSQVQYNSKGCICVLPLGRLTFALQLYDTRGLMKVVSPILHLHFYIQQAALPETDFQETEVPLCQMRVHELAAAMHLVVCYVLPFLSA